ncbi:uncharacterized protein LOC113279893 [Papaver somniferum]|uniref:uncharacterized protein LOC113279893 n=1 Tax=Papaver somniferum TaxID=3469 RepID=UPI000E6F9908|nr:uncharacterized protein LOC113279893 [Papaver somniferum]
MRDLTGRDLHRSTKNRFATQYYTLESIQKYKTPLQMMFVNDRWAKTRFSKENVGINALKIVTSSTFSEDVDYSCRVLKPLVKVVRLVDIERKPTMPSFYDAMRIARDQLEENFREDDDTWAVIKACFEKRWKNNFNHALHCAAYYLNPSIFYNIEPYEMDNNEKYIEIKRGLHKEMERLIPNEDELELATGELIKYTDVVGVLGTPPCKKRRTMDQPHEWWITFGGIDSPNLQKFTIRVLSLTWSASPCERNWSTFQNYNKKLKRHYIEIQKYNDDDKAYDPIFLEDRDENDEWLALENLHDLEMEGDNVTFGDLQETVGEECGIVGSRGACSSRGKSMFPTNSEYDGYDTDDLMLDTERGLLGGDGNDGVTPDDDIYADSSYID